MRVSIRPTWAIALLICATALTLPSHGVAAAGSTKRCPRADRDGLSVAVQERVMVCLVNAERRARGLAPVRRHPRLSRSAAAKSLAMLRCGEFSHTPCGLDFATTFRRAGYLGRSYSENIAWGTGRLGTPAAIHRAWMRSPGHRRNILGRSWRDVGVDVRRARGFQGQSGAVVWTAQYGS